MDRERIVMFNGPAFAEACSTAMGQRKISINRLAAESFVPYQTVYRMVTRGDVRHIEALLSVGAILGVSPLTHVAA